ncbi:MAG: tetratricopeptide repeat protein [Bacteroidota bacterium]
MEEDDLKDIEKIERYLEGRMEEAESKAFEEVLKHSAELRTQVDELLLAKGTLFHQGRTQLKKSLLDDWDRMTNPKPATLPRLWQYVALAASVALIVLMDWYVVNSALPQHSTDLYTSHYNHPQVSIIRNPDSLEQTITKAHLLYEQKQFTQASAIYASLIEQNPAVSEEVRFYQGICYLNMNRLDSALIHLQSLQSPNYIDAGKWYSILIRLKQGEVEQARKESRELAQNGSKYYKLRAQKLLSDLE